MNAEKASISQPIINVIPPNGVKLTKKGIWSDTDR